MKNKIIKDLNLLKSSNESLLDDVLDLEQKLYIPPRRTFDISNPNSGQIVSRETI